MRLYHGSNTKIEEIDLGQSKPNKDFGLGFYLSDDVNQAKEMAQFKANQLGGIPEVTEFEFDKDGIMNSNLSIKEFREYSEEWVDFIIANRNGIIKHDYDYIFGPIANDKVGRQLRLFNDKDITKDQLIERLKYFKGITFQYYFGTPESIKFLKPI